MAASPSTAAASSSTATDSNNNQWHQVFINHRGVDVKQTFAKDLYNRLRSMGLTAFLDVDELQPGYKFPPQIINAIETASVHVAILSPNYAESNWCLDELILMLKSEKRIIPVFYGVAPNEVRWTQRGKNGKYAQDLQKHEAKQRYSPNIIENWRNALSHVADISGFELDKCNIGNELERKLLDNVVACLSRILEKPDLPVPDYKTALNYKLEDFEEKILLPQQQSGKPQILGIWGLGGVGKTTLAKHFFNRKKSDYHRSCHLLEVRDNVAKSSLESLQSRLLKSLTGSAEQVNSVDEGKMMLKTTLESSKALIILDDVDDASHVQALLPVKTNELCSGSLILITCRHHDVLIGSRLVEKSCIYKLTSLCEKHARELFCYHALNQINPPPQFENLVSKFLETCEGFPLCLKVLGSHLYGRDIDYWKDQLGTFPREIKERLKISYDALTEMEREIFLDIACFFIGENRDTAISIWTGSGWNGRRGLQNLQDKSLVEVDSGNMIRMHDHLRDLGKDIAASSSRRRIWSWTENAIDKFLKKQSVINVRGIKMDLKDYNDYHDVLGRIGTKRLHIVDTEGKVLEHIWERVKVPKILWLRWINCPYASLPSTIQLKNLKFLQVSGSELNTLWERGSELQAPSQLPAFLEVLNTGGCVKLKSIRGLVQWAKLRILNVNGCSELEALPNMEKLVSLEEFYAYGCVKLKSIDGSVQWARLRILDVSWCSELEALPSMETLESLEKFYASGCVKLKRIRGLEQWAKLRIVNVDGCSELEALPSMEKLISLEEFYASGCVKLNRIGCLAHCTNLKRLCVSGCSALEDLPSMETLASLEEFSAKECVKLKSIKGLVGWAKLRMLNVSECAELEALPSMEKLAYLEEFYALGCVKLKSILGLEHCTKLRILYVNKCSELEELPSMENLLCLEEFHAYGCVKIKSIRGLLQWAKLRILSVSRCSELEALPSMESLVSLEEFYATECVKLKSIGALAQCAKLRILNFKGCSELEELPSMEELVYLEEVCAFGCVKLKSIGGLVQWSKLRILNVYGCFELEALPSMESLVSLEEIYASGCVKLKSIPELEHCRKLRVLYVNRWCELEALPSMETSVSLEEFYAKECVKLKSICGLAQCAKLRILNVDGCSGLEALPSMEELVSLEQFCAVGCVKLKSIAGLVQCPKLRILNVYGCYELEALPSMESLVSLEEIKASGCVKVKSIPQLEHCRKLRVLYVNRWCELEALPNMETLVSLEEFYAKECVKLKSIRGLAHCTKLRWLSVFGCSMLEALDVVKHCNMKEFDVSECPKLLGKTYPKVDLQSSASPTQS